MKLITFNINGVRSGIKKGVIEWLKTENPDVFCLQEIKLAETHLVEKHFTDCGYHCHWYPAQKRGYSGVATFTKVKPAKVYYGMNIEPYDFEGRTITIELENKLIVNTYFPSGSSGDLRQGFKFKFLDDYSVFINDLRKLNKPIIICGDVNICHQEIDIHNPKTNKNTSGFLMEEREWITKLLDSGFVDAFRFIDTEPHNYTWWTYRAGARQNNKGWRIDYFFVDKNIENEIKNTQIHADIFMSDHCPVSLDII
ncbi:MAG: exodeoxyribonuclease-3 [Spirosomataceae bacterium]|jgi:exodeoxyribonuclease-3